MIRRILKIAIPTIVLAGLGIGAVLGLRSRSFDQKLAAAEDSFKAKNYPEAVKIYSELLKSRPNDPQVIYGSAKSQFQQGKLTDDVAAYREVTNLFDRYQVLGVNMDGYPAFLSIAGISHFEQDNRERAKNLLEQSIDKDPANVESLLVLGRLALYSSGLDYSVPENGYQGLKWVPKEDIESARKILQKALSVRPDSDEARFYMAVIAYHEGDGTSAKKIVELGQSRSATTEMRLISNVHLLSEERLSEVENLMVDPNSARRNVLRTLSFYAVGLRDFLSGRIAAAQDSFDKARRNDDSRYLYFPWIDLNLARIQSWSGTAEARAKERTVLGRLIQQNLIQRRCGLRILRLFSYRPYEACPDDEVQAAGTDCDSEVAFHLFRASQPGVTEVDRSAIYSQILALDKDNPMILYNRGTLFLAKGNIGPAQLDLQSALSRSPKFREARLNLAIAYQKMQKPQQALAEYDKVLADRPNDPYALFGRALLLLSQDKPDQAISDLENVGEDNSVASDARIWLASLKAGRGDVESALKYAEKALEISPSNDLASIIVGNLNLRNGKPQVAAGYFEPVTRNKNSPMYSYAVNGTAMVRYEQSDLPAAERILADLIKETKTSTAFYLHNEGCILYRRNQISPAEQKFKAAIQEDPVFPLPHQALGKIEETRGNYKEAVARYTKALQCDKSFYAAQFNLAGSLASLGKSDEAIAAYREALKIRPDSLETVVNLAVLLAEEGDYTKAEELLNSVVEDPKARDDRQARILINNALAGLYARRGAKDDLSKAATTCDKTLNLSANDQTANLILGLTAVKNGNLGLAENYIEKARQRDKDSPAILANLGHALMNGPTQDLGRGLEYIKKAYQMTEDPKYGNIRNDVAVDLAMAYLKAGEYILAHDLLKETANNFPGDPPKDVKETLESLNQLFPEG